MFFSILLIAIAQTTGTEAGGLTAEGTLEPREIPFHHVARYRVVAEGPSGAEISLAPWDKPLPGLGVHVGEPEIGPAGNGRQKVVFVMQLTPTYPSRYVLPAVGVLLDGRPTATLEPGELTVRPLTPEEKAAAGEFEGLVTLAELENTQGGPWWPAVLLGGLVITGIAAIWWRRGRPWPARNGNVSPIDLALAQLDALEGRIARGNATCEEVYMALAAILREYLEQGCGMQIAELSTPEIVAGPLENLPVHTELKASLEELLVEADRVKFARDERDPEEQRDALAATRALLAELDAPDVAAAEMPGAA